MYKRFQLEKITIDKQGYDDSGKYWGASFGGVSLWKLVDHHHVDKSWGHYFRAANPLAAISYALENFGSEFDEVVLRLPKNDDGSEI